jgi:hypothetical protein
MGWFIVLDGVRDPLEGGLVLPPAWVGVVRPWHGAVSPGMGRAFVMRRAQLGPQNWPTKPIVAPARVGATIGMPVMRLRHLP